MASDRDIPKESDGSARKQTRLPLSPKAAPCPICGENAFEWGRASGHYTFRFRRDTGGFLEKMTVLGGTPIRARRCRTCGNVQLFATARS